MGRLYKHHRNWSVSICVSSHFARVIWAYICVDNFTRLSFHLFQFRYYTSLLWCTVFTRTFQKETQTTIMGPTRYRQQQTWVLHRPLLPTITTEEQRPQFGGIRNLSNIYQHKTDIFPHFHRSYINRGLKSHVPSLCNFSPKLVPVKKSLFYIPWRWRPLLEHEDCSPNVVVWHYKRCKRIIYN